MVYGLYKYLTQNIQWIIVHFLKNEWVNVWVNVLIILEITELNSNWLVKEELVRRNIILKSNVLGKIKEKNIFKKIANIT